LKNWGDDKSQKIVMGPDHVGPQTIIDVKVQESVPTLMLLDHQAVLSNLFWELSAILALMEDLVIQLA